jgi:hypothetical protein
MISLVLFVCWVPKGINSLKNKDSLLKSSLAYPSEQRAINILETSVKLKTFMPIAQIYKYLPSYYAFANKISKVSLYTIESISLNNTKTLYSLSYNIQTSNSSNTPLPLYNNQKLQIVLPNGLLEGTINAISILQGNYNNSADGLLKVEVCNNSKCSQGERSIPQSTDNSFFAIPLKTPLDITKGQINIDVQHINSTKPEAIWIYPPIKDYPQIIYKNGNKLPNKAVQLDFIYQEPNKIKLRITKSDENFIQISGWAVDSVSKNADNGVIAVIDNKYFYPLQNGNQRPDVSKAFNNTNYEYSGFNGSIPLNELDSGKHILTLRIINSDETGYYESKPIELNIENKLK